jgi:hypothetical protein
MASQAAQAELQLLKGSPVMSSVDSLLAELDLRIALARRERKAAAIRLIEAASAASDQLLSGIAVRHPWSLLAVAATTGAVLTGVGAPPALEIALVALRSRLLSALGSDGKSSSGPGPVGEPVPPGEPSHGQVEPLVPGQLTPHP